ncbi:MAG: hypothetical protein WAK50_14045 [Nitrososphaeraceae archaeon]
MSSVTMGRFRFVLPARRLRRLGWAGGSGARAYTSRGVTLAALAHGGGNDLAFSARGTGRVLSGAWRRVRRRR